jgi:hypothetical protein
LIERIVILLLVLVVVVIVGREHRAPVLPQPMDGFAPAAMQFLGLDRASTEIADLSERHVAEEAEVGAVDAADHDAEVRGQPFEQLGLAAERRHEALFELVDQTKPKRAPRGAVATSGVLPLDHVEELLLERQMRFQAVAHAAGERDPPRTAASRSTRS